MDNPFFNHGMLTTSQLVHNFASAVSLFLSLIFRHLSLILRRPRAGDEGAEPPALLQLDGPQRRSALGAAGEGRLPRGGGGGAPHTCEGRLGRW